MKKYLQLIVALTFVCQSGMAVAADGKAVFEANKCNKCHSIEAAQIEKASDKIKAPDLSHVGKAHDAAWIGKWVKKEETLKGKKHMIMFKGTDEELAALTSWLGGMK